MYLYTYRYCYCSLLLLCDCYCYCSLLLMCDCYCCRFPAASAAVLLFPDHLAPPLDPKNILEGKKTLVRCLSKSSFFIKFHPHICDLGIDAVVVGVLFENPIWNRYGGGGRSFVWKADMGIDAMVVAGSFFLKTRSANICIMYVLVCICVNLSFS